MNIYRQHIFLGLSYLTMASLAAMAADPQAMPTDPQIAAIVVTANTVDVDAGKMAKTQTKNPEVKKFAEQMITDHSSVNKSATDLVTKLKVKPEPSDTSK